MIGQTEISAAPYVAATRKRNSRRLRISGGASSRRIRRATATMIASDTGISSSRCGCSEATRLCEIVQYQNGCHAPRAAKYAAISAGGTRAASTNATAAGGGRGWGAVAAGPGEIGGGGVFAGTAGGGAGSTPRSGPAA